MNHIFSIPILLFLLFITTLGMAETGTVEKTHANSEQELIVEQDNNLLTETDALVEGIQLKTKEAKEKYVLFKKSTGEKRSLVGIQVLDIETDLRKSLDILISNINTLNSQGVNTDKFISVAKKITKDQSDSIITEIELISKLMGDLEKERDKAEIDKMFLLEQKINQGRSNIDQLLKALFENTERMKLIGLDANKELDYLKNELQDFAKNSSTRIKFNADKITDLKRGIEKAGEKQNLDLVGKLNALEEREAGLIASLRHTINLMKQLGLETSKHSLLLVRSVGKVDEALLDKKVVLSLLDEWLTDAKNWLIDNGVSIIVKIFTIILILLVFKLLAKIAERLVRKAMASSKTHISQLLQDFFENMISKLVMLIGVLVVLAHIGVQIGPLLAGLGVVGFIVGFALQDTLSNFASGIMILIYRPYDVGDIIEAAGQRGTVYQMNLVSTTVFTFDNQRLIIPNNKIWGDIIRNVTSQEKRRVDLEFSVSHDTDIDQAENILHDVIKQNELILDDPEPVVKLHRIEDDSLKFIVRPWVKTDDYWPVYWDITRAVKQRFIKEGISQPVSRHDIQIAQVPE